MLSPRRWIDALDEPLRLLELRRYSRILRTGRLPTAFALATLALGWVLGPMWLNVTAPQLLAQRGTMSGLLLTAAALAAAAGGFLRSQQFWQQERQVQGFSSLVLAGVSPTRFVFSSILLSGALGLTLALTPLVIGVAAAVVGGGTQPGIVLQLLFPPVLAVVGAALGAVVFFVGVGAVPPRWAGVGIAVFALVTIGLWARLENPAKQPPSPGPPVLRAVSLWTPVPALLATSAPQWWRNYAGEDLGWPGPAWTFTLATLCGAMGVAAGAAALTVCSYRRLVERLEASPEPSPGKRVEEAGEEFYWRGFRNPILTREVRTRLRSGETAEMIFLASTMIAVGGCLPLISTTGDLSDPLQTARASREVFFWLTMTLVALLTLLGPAITADVITRERASGALELLIITPLRPRELLAGKLFGGVGVLLLLLSPALPLMGLCFLFHGADLLQVAQVAALLALTVVVTCLIGVTQSAIHLKRGWAKLWAHLIALLFAALPGGPFWIAINIASADVSHREPIGNAFWSWTAAMAVLWLVLLTIFWGNAKEQLEYHEF